MVEKVQSDGTREKIIFASGEIIDVCELEVLYIKVLSGNFQLYAIIFMFMVYDARLDERGDCLPLHNFL